jgi:multiple sugar transport system permease protein
MTTDSLAVSKKATVQGPLPASRLSTWVDKHAFAVLLAPAVSVLLVLGAFPFVYSLWLSFNEWNLADRTATWHFVGPANYVAIFTSDPFFRSAVEATVKFVGGSVLVEVLLGLAIALLLNREFAGQGLVRTLVMLPVMTTPVAVGLIWRFMYNPDRGIVNYLLSLIGVQGIDWLARENTAMPAVILVDAWEWTPFVALILLAALQSLDREPLEAALIDGANSWQRFRYVVFPMIQPALLVAVLIRLMDAFKSFDILYVLTLGGPGVSTQVLSLYTYKYGFKFFQMGYAAALSYVMVISVIILANVFIRRMRRA